MELAVRVIHTLAVREDPGTKVSFTPTPIFFGFISVCPTPALTRSLLYRKSRRASSHPINSWWVLLPIHGPQQVLTKCPRLKDLVSGPSSDI